MNDGGDGGGDGGDGGGGDGGGGGGDGGGDGCAPAGAAWWRAPGPRPHDAPCRKASYR